MSVTDAEREFYESVIEDPEGKSLADLRYAYFLAALDGGLPSGPVAVPEGLTTTGTPSATTYLSGDGSWATPPNTTYTAIAEAEATTGTATTARAVSAASQARDIPIRVRAYFATLAGYDGAVAQTLTHDAAGVLTWVASA